VPLVRAFLACSLEEVKPTTVVLSWSALANPQTKLDSLDLLNYKPQLA
jgi:hypothetical protein